MLASTVHNMGEKRSLAVTSNRYIPDHDVFSGRPYKSHFSKIEVDEDNLTMELTHRQEKDDLHTRFTDNSYVYCELRKSEILKLLQFLAKAKPSEEGQTSTIDISLNSGICRSRHYANGQVNIERENEEEIDRLHIEANKNTLIFETFGDMNPIFPYYETEHNGDPQDRANLAQLQSFSEGLEADIRAPVAPELNLLSDGLKKTLEATKWGAEVLEHLNDGDECVRNELFHPALNCYVHAIEWAIISYLEAARDIDIIEQEDNGDYHTYHELLDELSDTADIDQKTKSKLSIYNSAERRWTAHHKTGKTTLPDITAVRNRLLILIEQLFSNNSTV